MTAALNRQWLVEAIGRSRFVEAFALVDPYAPDAAAGLQAGLAEAGRRLAGEIQAALELPEALSAYRTALSLAGASTFERACVGRAAREAGALELDPLWSGLDRAFRAMSPAEAGALVILGSTPEAVPRLPDSLLLPAGLRLRFALAAESRKGFHSLRLLAIAIGTRRCSRIVAERELLKALHAVAGRGQAVRRLTPANLASLTPQTAALLGGDLELLGQIRPNGVSVPRARRLLERRWRNHLQVKKQLVELARAVQTRSISDANRVARRIRLDDLDVKLRAGARRRLEAALLRPELLKPVMFRSPAPGNSRWQPFSRPLCRLLVDLVGTRPELRLLGSSRDAVIKAWIRKPSLQSALTAPDLERLISSMPVRVLQKLLRSEKVGAQDSRIRWLMEKSADEQLLEQLEQALQSEARWAEARRLLRGRENKRLRKEVQWLLQSGGADQRWLGLLAPLFGERTVGALLPDGPEVLSVALARLRLPTPCLDPDRFHSFLRARCPAEASAARSFLLAYWKASPDNCLSLLTPNRAQCFETSADAVSSRLYWLCMRRTPAVLKSCMVRAGDSAPEAIRRASTELPPRSRARGYLELCAALGQRYVRMLAAVLARTRFGAKPGHKYDHQYRSYSLPKRSGGKRLVSAPSPVLKAVQRGLLAHVIRPLGAHKNAYGFVPGRSIALNAGRHVGNRVVTNCDIKDCFPSVKWSLVLGILRRDLGRHYSPAAMSLIVDICTARGALPIGAPTSPALLNRVLLRTDEILSAAASTRRCTYSRYADDLTFSGSGRAVGLLGVARRTLSQIGLELDPKKSNIYRRGRRQIVTGLVVNSRVSVPRRIRRRLRAAVHAAEVGKVPSWHGKPVQDASMLGRLAHVASIHPETAKPLIERYKRARARKRR